MTKLSLSLLGAFRAALNGKILTGFRTNKAQALLIYLVVEPEPQRREHLMTLLWPGMPERSARHNLRQILYHLRQAIPDLSSESDKQTAVSFLLTNRQTIQLNPTAVVMVDVHQFEEQLKRTQTHNHVDLFICHSCRQTLEQAVGLYNGDFLSDFYLDDSNDFEEWAEIKRQSYRRQALDALETLTTIHTRQTAYPEAQGFAQRQLEIDNLRESAYRQLMEIYALNGRREEALALYESCRRLLAEELGMAPTVRTTAMYEKIVAGDLRFDAPEQRGVRGFELKEEIGSGAYGTIYRAVQSAIGRDVAVKVIRRRYANDPEFIRRFESEAQTIARLEHPYIVPLYDYWREPDGAYLVMRLLRGGSLLSALENGPLAPDSTVTILSQLASALTTAHRQGIVHRDIKPANILFDEANNAYLSDFGIAKDLGHDLGLTAAGAMIGTPDYISPEQLTGQEVTPQSDQYSLGAVLYETLTGEKPFSEAPIAIRIQKHLVEPLPFVCESRPDLPRQLDDVIQRATAKEPMDRFPDTLAMAEAFRLAVQGTASPSLLTTAVPSSHELNNPYKGLQAFQESDAHDFFGRETLIEQLVAGLAQSRFLAVVGPSGAGKSSVVKAGLIPALRQGAVADSENWFVTEMVPGTHPLEELELALLPVAVDPPPSLLDPLQKDERGLLRTLRRILPKEDGHLLLVIDQFEELFTLTDSAVRHHFFLNSLLAALNAPRSPLHVVVTLRADFYDRPLQMQPMANLFKEHTELILPMTGEELAWVIQEPARRVGVVLEDGLVAAIVNEMADQPGALPLLQYALTELFEERQGQMMTLAAYRALGGATGALALRAEEIYGRLATAAQAATRQLFLRLVTLGEGVEDTRRRVLRSELRAIQASEGFETLEASNEVIEVFGNYRLLTFDRDPITREATVEVAHEALLREWHRLRSWLDESRVDVRLQRLLAAATYEWLAAEKQEGYLLRGARLDQFEGWVAQATVALTYNEQAFLAASSTARRQRREVEAARRQRELGTAQQLAETERQRAEEQSQSAQTLRRRAVYLGMALVVAVIFAVVAGLFSRQSAQNEAIAIGNAATAVAEGERADGERDAALSVQATSEAEAEARATAEVEANVQRDTAVAAQATAQAETSVRATAEAVAQEQATLATARESASWANSTLEKDPQLSLLLAQQSLAQVYTAEGEASLHRAIQQSRIRMNLTDHTDVAWVVASNDGRYIATASWDDSVILWDAITGRALFTYYKSGIDWWRGKLAFNADSSQLAILTGGNDFLSEGESEPLQIVSWSVQAASEMGEAQIVISTTLPVNDTTAVSDYNISSDLSLFAVGYSDGIVELWDVFSGQLRSRFSAHSQLLYALNFSPDSSQLATASDDATVKVWRVADLFDETEPTLVLPYEFDLSEGSVAFSPDNTLLASSTGSNIFVWNLIASENAEPGELLYTPSHNNIVQNLTFNSNGTQLATASQDSTAKIWDMTTGEALITLSGHQRVVSDVYFAPDGKTVITADDGTVKIWDISTDGQSERFDRNVHDAAVKSLVVDSSGALIASSSDDTLAHLLDSDSGEIVQTFAGHQDWIFGLSLSSDGSRLATSSLDGTAKVWDTQSGLEIATIDVYKGFGINVFPGILDVAIHPQNKDIIVTARADGLVNIHNLANDELISRTVLGPSYSINNLVFNTDGSYLAAAGQGTNSDLIDTVMIWETTQYEPVVKIEIPTLSWDMDFSPDSQLLAVGMSFGLLQVYAVTTGELLFDLEGHTSAIWRLRFDQSGKRLITLSFDGTVKLWDMETGLEQFTLPLTGLPSSIDVSPDGHWLYVGTGDGRVAGFALALENLLLLANSRTTRSLTEAECQQYLHLDACPEEISNR